MANMYESQHLLATQSIPNQNREVDEEEEEEEEDEGDFEVSMSPNESAAEDDDHRDGIGGDLSKKPKKNIKRDVDDAVTDEVDRPSFVAELSPRVVETVLQVNMELIRLCVEYQNRGWFQDPDYAIYQARLQSNLIYLASVADYHLKPDKASLPAPSVPHAQLAPISVNAPTALSERINGLLTAARKAQEEQTQVWRTEMERQSRNAFERLHQAERERAFNSTTGITTGHGHTDNDHSMALSGDLRKRKRVNEATKVVRVMDQQAGIGSVGSYQPLPPFVFGGAGITLPGRLSGAPMVMGASSTTNHLPLQPPQPQAQAQIQPSTATMSQNIMMGSHGGLPMNYPMNVATTMPPQMATTTTAVTGTTAAATGISAVPPSVSLQTTAESASYSAASSINMTPQIAQLVAQLGISPSAVAQLAASGTVSSSDLLQLTNLAMSGYPNTHPTTAAAPTTTTAAAATATATHSISNALHPPPTLPISNESTTNQAQDLLTNTDRAGLSPHSQDVNPTGHPHQNNHRQHHNNNNSNNNGNNNSNSNATFASLGNLEAIAAASGLDPTTLGVLSPQALLNAFASSGNEDISNSSVGNHSTMANTPLNQHGHSGNH